MQQLIYEYINGSSQSTISLKYGISIPSVSRILNGIMYKDSVARPQELWDKLFDQRYYKNEHKLNLPNLTQHQQNIVTGSLLGDAWLKKPNGYWSDSKFEKQQKYLEPIAWMHKELSPFTNFCKIQIVKRRNILLNLPNRTVKNVKGIFKKCGYVVSTTTHPFFTELWRKWYIPGSKKYVKIVPSDIVLNPEILAMWFVDDGSNSPQKRQKHCKLSTDGFKKIEIDFLLRKLYNDLGLVGHAAKDTYKEAYSIQFSGPSYHNLLKMITPYVFWDCMLYKLFKEPTNEKLQIG